MKCIDEIPASELKGKRVFLRTSLNLPVASDGSVSDIFRLKRGLPTIDYLCRNGARVIIAGYLGRKGDSMQPVANALMHLAPHLSIRFFGTSFDHAPAESAMLRDGECLVLESTRRDPREEAKDPELAKLFASCADIYVSDAFAEAHRDYASNVGIAEFLPSYAGLLMRDELQALNAARQPEHPSFAILGGAKFETKAPLISLLLERYDKVFITGALANDVFKAKGMPVGRSLISAELPSESVLTNKHFLAPVDVTVEKLDKQALLKSPENVSKDDKIVDIGPDSVAMLAPLIAEAKFILWNGPTGLYEDGYMSYTLAIVDLISKSRAQKVVGGGDTIALIEEARISGENLGFLSTGGGAMLEYLLKGSLPAIEVLG